MMGINYQQPQLVNHQLSLFTLSSHHHGSVENGWYLQQEFPPSCRVIFSGSPGSARRSEVRQHVPRLAGWVVGVSRCAFPTLAPARGAGGPRGCDEIDPQGQGLNKATSIGKNVWSKFLHASKRNLYKWVHLGWLIQIWHEFSIDVLPEGIEVDESIQRSSALRNP